VKALLLTTFAVILFFGLALYSIRREERRGADRRRWDAPIPAQDRRSQDRSQDRRRGGLGAYLGWVLRALRATFTR
jgi:hypothetical protein